MSSPLSTNLTAQLTVPIVVNLRREQFDVYIGRGSVFGNPWTHLPLRKTSAQFQVATVEEALAKYEPYARENIAIQSELGSLSGKRLGCYCAPGPCHGDILVKLFREKFL